nr:GGDEF domain-containing protein [uncultured Roseococcus sp.]
MMTPDDLAFLALRSLACILCFYAGWRSFRQAYTYREHHERFVRAVFGGVLAVLLGVLAIAIGLWEAFVRPGDPIGFKEWIYTVILIVLPAFFLNLLDSFAQRDVLERKLAEAAYHDSLTGLPNRAGHAALAGYALAQSHAAGRPASIATLDVDHFKSINDGWGHAAGDAVLRAIACSLRQNLRDGDVVSRAGGEEFNILLRGVAPTEALPLVDRLREAVARDVAHPGAPLARVSISGGVALVEGEGPGAIEAATRLADTALYEAKNAGRDRVVIASPCLSEKAEARGA